MMRPSSVRGEVDGSVNSRCMPRNTAAGTYASMKKYEPKIARYGRLNSITVATAAIVIVVTPNRYWPGRAIRKIHRRMYGGSSWVFAISCPHVIDVLCVNRRPRENRPRGNEEGLKM